MNAYVPMLSLNPFYMRSPYEFCINNCTCMQSICTGISYCLQRRNKTRYIYIEKKVSL